MALLFTIALTASGVILFEAYSKSRFEVITSARIAVVAITVLLFILILSDDHIFEDSTVPQIVEEHMTELAKHRHGNKSVNVYEVVSNFLEGNDKP